jgi:DNA-binding transcriptional LysR family regulator
VHSLKESAQLLRRGGSGVLRVAATPQTIDGVFSTFLHRYAERHPNVQITLVEAVGAELELMLERGQVHLTVSLIQQSQADNPFIESFRLSSLEFLAASSKWLEVGASGDIEITHLSEYPLLLPHTSFYVRKTFDAACRVAGVKAKMLLESRAPHALLALAEAGHGVAIVPSVMPTSRYRLRVARITHEHRPLRETFAVLWDKRRTLPPYARDLCEMLAAHMQEVLPTTEAFEATRRSVVKQGSTPGVRKRG